MTIGPSSSRVWRRFAQYGVAVLAAAISLAARRFMTPAFGLELLYITLFPAIAFTAWFGGLGPGITCTALTAIWAAYLWVPSSRFFARWPTVGDALGIVLFSGVGLFISVLAEQRLRAQARIERQIAEVRQAQERERDARNEAEHANKAKDEFLAVLAHELRQPLAAIVAALGVVRQRLGPEGTTAIERSIGAMQRQTNHLQRLVEDLLDASRVVRGQVVLQRQPLNALDIVRDIIEASRPGMDERGQRLEVRVPPAPVIVNADATRLQQVLLNVLSNATRYTQPAGDIRILVEPNGAWLTIRVQD